MGHGDCLQAVSGRHGPFYQTMPADAGQECGHGTSWGGYCSSAACSYLLIEQGRLCQRSPLAVESRGGAVVEVLAWSVADPFGCRCPNVLHHAPFPPPAHQTGRADFPHPAFGQGFMRSPTERCVCPREVGPSRVRHAGKSQGTVKIPVPAACAFGATTVGACELRVG